MRSLARWADKRGTTASRSVGQAVELLRAQPGGAWVGLPFRFLNREEIYRQFREAFGDGFHAVINEAIDSAPVASFPIAKLRGIQHTISKDRVEQYVRNPKLVRRGTKSPDHGGLVDLPIVCLWKGEWVVYDGHHRATAEFFRGSRFVEARKVDLDALLAAASSHRG